MGAMLGILFLGIIQGIAIGVTLSLLLLIARASQTSVRRLGLEPSSGVYLDLASHQGLQTTPGVLVVRIDGPLFFADANRFRESLRKLVSEAAMPVTSVVVDAESVQMTDTDGADILIQVGEELKADGARLVFARVHPPIFELWRRAGLPEAQDGTRVFKTVRDAVAAESHWQWQR